MNSDILLNKSASIERCIKRIHEDYTGHEHDFTTNYTRQDAIILNLQRACETAIDMASHIVRIRHLGLPQSSGDVFVLLEQAKIISEALSHHLQAMVGFRNIAVHEYTNLDLEVVISIIKNRLNDFLEFNKQVLALGASTP
jgi:uncharacterized protein YutE (UPF0331/DUF86 family)